MGDLLQDPKSWSKNEPLPLLILEGVTLMSKCLAYFHTAPLGLVLEFSLIVNNSGFIGDYIEDNITHRDMEDNSIYRDIENSIQGSNFTRSTSI